MGLAAALLLGAAGCWTDGGVPREPYVPRTAPPSPVVTRPAATSPTLPDLPASWDFREVCDGRGFRDTGAYAGRGPHPVKIPMLGPDTPPGGGELEIEAVPPGWKTENPRSVQLVACITTTRDGPRVKICDYVGTHGTTGRFRVEMRWRDYAVDVRSARTGRKVTPTARVRGAETDCADYEVGTAGEPFGPQFTFLSPAQVRALIGRWVTRGA
jgi:hypothetical protein